MTDVSIPKGLSEVLPTLALLVMLSLVLNAYLIIVGLFSVVCRAKSVSISEVKVLKTGQIMFPPDAAMSYIFFLCSAWNSVVRSRGVALGTLELESGKTTQVKQQDIHVLIESHSSW
jgi:hypothetical protein